jgi:hypothetical protein
LEKEAIMSDEIKVVEEETRIVLESLTNRLVLDFQDIQGGRVVRFVAQEKRGGVIQPVTHMQALPMVGPDFVATTLVEGLEQLCNLFEWASEIGLVEFIPRLTCVLLGLVKK